MENLKNHAIVTLKLLFNSHLVLFFVCVLLFNIIIHLQQILILPVSMAFLSCYAFFENENLDDMCGTQKIISAISNGEFSSRIMRNILFAIFALTISGVFSVMKNDWFLILIGLATYTTSLSLWYLLHLFLKNVVLITIISLLYVFIWIVYYRRFPILYFNPFYLIAKSHVFEQDLFFVILSICILAISIWIHSNRFLFIYFFTSKKYIKLISRLFH